MQCKSSVWHAATQASSSLTFVCQFPCAKFPVISSGRLQGALFHCVGRKAAESRHGSLIFSKLHWKKACAAMHVFWPRMPLAVSLRWQTGNSSPFFKPMNLCLELVCLVIVHVEVMNWPVWVRVLYISDILLPSLLKWYLARSPPPPSLLGRVYKDFTLLWLTWFYFTMMHGISEAQEYVWEVFGHTCSKYCFYEVMHYGEVQWMLFLLGEGSNRY